MEFNSQICTSREQSERLLGLGLKKETADMVYFQHWKNAARKKHDVDVLSESNFPAWSLHRLLLLIPKEVNIDGHRFPLRSDAVMRLDEADDMYEYLIGVLERSIKDGYFPSKLLF